MKCNKPIFGLFTLICPVPCQAWRKMAAEEQRRHYLINSPSFMAKPSHLWVLPDLIGQLGMCHRLDEVENVSELSHAHTHTHISGSWPGRSRQEELGSAMTLTKGYVIPKFPIFPWHDHPYSIYFGIFKIHCCVAFFLGWVLQLNSASFVP